MILLILAAVYRAPLLVAIPMISIGFAVLVSTSLVALLTSWSIEGTVPGLDLRVFTTSRIFVVVILFGAGTDYCLFLIARLREEAAKAPWPSRLLATHLSGVMGALMGSAMTTVVGLGMLWIAQFRQVPLHRSDHRDLFAGRFARLHDADAGAVAGDRAQSVLAVTDPPTTAPPNVSVRRFGHWTEVRHGWAVELDRVDADTTPDHDAWWWDCVALDSRRLRV